MKHVITCNSKIEKELKVWSEENLQISLIHQKGEPLGVNRLLVKSSNFSIEFLPSRGLSLGQAYYNGRPIFWDAPASLDKPAKIKFSDDDVHINGKPAPGFGYIKHFMGGIELLGLENWGMPRVDNSGKFHVLHGEAHSIPLNEVCFSHKNDTLVIEGRFFTRTFRGLPFKPWYKRGSKRFEVIRRYELRLNKPSINLLDTFVNQTDKPLTPDWGYHITFFPEPGARYIVPALEASPRGGGKLPQDYQIWQPSPDTSTRIEKGIIFKRIKCSENSHLVTSILEYPGGTGIAIHTQPAPYFQTWFCSGGKGSKEFTYPCGTPLLKKNWDGIGIEIGSSPLDHDGNKDQSVKAEKPLNPGESRTIVISIDILDETVTREIIHSLLKN